MAKLKDQLSGADVAPPARAAGDDLSTGAEKLNAETIARDSSFNTGSNPKDPPPRAGAPGDSAVPQKAVFREDQTPPTAKPGAGESSNAIVDFLNTQDETLFRSPMVADTFRVPYNRDELYRKTGDYRIYEKMAFDDQVSICLSIKKDLVLGSGYDFVATDEGQEEMIEFLTKAFGDEAKFPFVDRLEEILSAYEYGFSLTEKLFGFDDAGMVVVRDLMTREPNSWLLYQDRYGRVNKFEQNTYEEGKKAINPKALIHYTVNQKFQNPYGTSDLRVAYDAWFIKREVVKFFAIFMEKAASPLPIGTYDKNAPQAAVDEILNILKKLQTKTAMVIPKDVEVEFLEAKSNGEAYHKAIGIFNMMIGRALFLPDLMGFSGAETGGGSYSLGKEQMAVFFMHIARRRNALETIVNQELIRPVCQQNWNPEKFPRWKIKPIDDSQAIELAKAWLEAVKGKIYVASDEEINHFRSLCKFPEGDVERAKEPAPMQIGPDGKPLPPKPGAPIPGEDDQEEEEDDAKAGNKAPDKPEKKEFSVKKADITVVVGSPGSGKTWVTSQMRDKFDVIQNDDFIGKGGLSAYLAEIIDHAEFSKRPILVEAPFSVTQVVEPLRAAGHQVTPVFIIENDDLQAERYKARENKEIPAGHLARNKTYLERAIAGNHFYGSSEQVLQHLRARVVE